MNSTRHHLHHPLEILGVIAHVAKLATGHFLTLKDAKAALLTGVGLMIRKELQASPAEAPAETDQRCPYPDQKQFHKALLCL
jgi:hypothetical protein